MKLSAEITNTFSDIDEKKLINILFEMNRFYDKNFKNYFSDYKVKYGETLDSFQRKMLRNYYYYGNREILIKMGINEFPTMQINEEDIKELDKMTVEKLKLPSKEKIIKSVYSRFKENNKYDEERKKAKKWIKEQKNKNNYDFIKISIDQNFIDENIDYFDRMLEIINYSYDKLSNYRYIAIVLNEKIYKEKKDISWDFLSKIAIYMENYKSYVGKYYAFKKQIREKELIDFLDKNTNLKKYNYNKMVSDFYSSISTGFSFSDILVSDDQNKKILIMKKIELDERPIPCPSCLEMKSRGNSYPLMFLKSWECQNPKCPERSKSGRGKRYDEYGVYRYFKLVENSDKNIIDKKMYSEWRRDIFSKDSDIDKMLLMYYSWNKERILFIDNLKSISNFKDRKIDVMNYSAIENIKHLKYDELPILILLKKIYKQRKKSKPQRTLTKKIELYNENSIYGLQTIERKRVKYAITSPPYYNAREYSQWPNLITYLVDMMLDAGSVYEIMDPDGVYLYNIGDIVDSDNVYVASHMSKRRIMLGFYSSLIFEIVGFYLMGNKIWDKGEVESKRNSTINLVSGYVKYVNCYEHVLVFRKKENLNINDNVIYKIKPVYKINNKGQNILGHTAPYPEELVDLINLYIDDKKYLLDPFLGSGTTGIWAKKHGVNFIGFELNKDYYKLAIERINNCEV